MEPIARLFVQNPAGLALVSGLFVAAWWLVRTRPSIARPDALLWVALVWGVWAIWELTLILFSPESDMRVDLLLLIPAALVATVVGLTMTFWRKG